MEVYFGEWGRVREFWARHFAGIISPIFARALGRGFPYGWGPAEVISLSALQGEGEPLAFS